MKKYSFTIGGKSYEVEIGSIEGRNAKVSVNGKDYEVTLAEEMAAAPAAPAPTMTAAM